jgi:hypothetical protein
MVMAEELLETVEGHFVTESPEHELGASGARGGRGGASAPIPARSSRLLVAGRWMLVEELEHLPMDVFDALGRLLPAAHHGVSPAVGGAGPWIGRRHRIRQSAPFGPFDIARPWCY